MNFKSLAASVTMAGLLVGASATALAASDSPSVNGGPESMELKVGDKAPDKYGRSDMAMKNWKGAGLKQPSPDSQWVQMDDAYVLIKRTNSTIEDIQPVPK